MSVRPWATIEDRITNAAMSKIVDEAPTSDLSTKSANSIEATPLGPNQAMNAFWGPGSRLRRNEIMMASGRATSSARRMNAARRQISPS